MDNHRPVDGPRARGPSDGTMGGVRVMVTVAGSQTARCLVVDAPEGATTADLHARLGTDAPPGGRAGPLRHGYAVDAPVGGVTAGPAAVRVVVVAGPDAGGSVALPPGHRVTVGRASGCDLTVRDATLSREHVRVHHERSGVVVEDLGSTNGLHWDPDPAAGTAPEPPTSLRRARRTPCGPPPAATPWPAGAALRVGATQLVLVVDPPVPAAGREDDGRLLITPWPRPRRPRRTVRLSLPAAPQPREVRAPSPWVWGLPLAASVAVAAVLRMPLVLLFGLMAPAMVLGHHLGERRSARLDHRAALRQHRVRLRECRAAAARAMAHDLSLLREEHPGLLAPVTALLPWPTTRLWSRTGEPPVVVVGEGRVPAGVEVDGEALHHDDAPVILDLSDPVAVVGPPRLRSALVRGWVLQLACGLPPSQLAFVVDPAAPPPAEWDLLAWLPHTRPTTPAASEEVRIAWGRPDGLLLVDTPQEAPAGTVQIVVQDATTAELRRPGQPDVPFRPTSVALPLARSLARALGALDHRAPSQTAARGPVPLGELLPWPTTTAQVHAGWSGGVPRLDVPIGLADDGEPLTVDLARDGPHALVAGTTGSGKSELLRTLITALALRNSPMTLSLLLIDYKGGSSLGECASFPHTTGLVTDLDPHLAERVLVSLRAELRRRETLLARAGARDVRDLVDPELPRLLVVIDEFRVLAEELPEFLDALVRLAAVGRSLGVHLVLATQRPGGVVSADLRANVNLRIALRVRDRSDSLDVLEVPDAAALPEGQPGRGLLRTGSGSPRGLRVAPAAGCRRRPAESGWRVEEVDGPWTGWLRLQAGDPVETVDSDLGALPGLFRRAVKEDARRPPRVWEPPLAETVPSAAHPGAWAVADRPDRQRHEPVRWDLGGHLAVAGSARSGRTTAARALLAAAGPAWLYVLDTGRGLEGTEAARHPGLRAWVGPEDPAHAVRVLEVVNGLVDSRTARGRSQDLVPVVLLVDGWDRFVEAYGDVAHGRARDLALRVLKDGAGAGVVALLTGDRSVLIGAVSSAVPETWALRLNDPGDLAVAGLHPRQVPAHQPPGRAVRTRDGLVAQVLLPDCDRASTDPPPGPAPPRVVSLPATLPDLPRVPSPGVVPAWAVGGDEAGAVRLPPGPLLVLGPPGSGVTTTLASVGRHLGEVTHVDSARLADAEVVRSALVSFTGTVVVDEAHLLTGSEVEEVVLGWAERHGGRLVVGADLEAAGSLFRGLVPQVARHRRGVVLQPGSPADGALLGVRLPTADRRVPGRGVLVDRGRCTRVQVLPVSPRVRPRPPPSPADP